MIDDRRGEGRFWATVALALILVLAVVLRDPVPSPRAADAANDDFSAARARSVLARVLAREEPHPTGTSENDHVRERVLSELRDLGFDPSVEETLVCAEYGSCAIVRNVIAELPGRTPGPSVLLNAHYDSVAASPGAADDGAGVAVLLEAARALKTGPPPERTIRFLIDDGEEAGLLGAEAWTRGHTVDETLAVLALEARGSSGPALLFETNPHNLALVRAYASAVPDPAASSLFFSLYERLPNRTNFTVFKREGYAGMAVAFIEDPAQYHTRLNDLERLSDGSLQHMGNLTLSMARELSAKGLPHLERNASYFDLLGATVVLWPESWNIWLSVAALLLVAATGFVAIRKERASSLQILLGWFVIVLVVLVAAGLGWLGLIVARGRSGDAGWIANGGYLAVAAWLLAAAVVSAPYTFVRRTPTVLSIWTSVWLLNGIIGVVLARLLPGAAYLFFIPTLAAGLSGVISLVGRRPERNEGMIVVPFGVSLLLTAPILAELYTALGLVAVPGIAALVTVLLLPLLVVSTEARRPAILTMICATGAVVCVVAFALTPVFSAEVPRALNVIAVHGADGTTSAVLLGNADPLPESIADAASWSQQPVEIFRRPGGGRAGRFWTAAIEAPEVERPDLSSSTFDSDEGEGTLRLVARVVDHDSVLRVQFPDGTALGELSCGDHTIALSPAQGPGIALRGVPAEGCTLIATLEAGSSVDVIEERPGLPPAARAIADRRTDAEVPIGPGDRSMIVSRLVVADLPPTPPIKPEEQ